MACDECSVWYHSQCLELSATNVSLLQKDLVSWLCCKCDSCNVDSFTYHSFELDISNRYEILNSRRLSSVDSYSSIPSVDSSFSPSAFSSPKPRLNSVSTSQNETSKSSAEQYQKKKRNNFRVLVMNCQSIRNKRSELNESIEYVKPDAIIGCESWLASEHKNCEIFPEGYNKNVFRKDRNKNGGGVFISVHDTFNTVTVESGENDCELQWTEVQTKEKSVLIGSFYRPPNAKIDCLENLQSSMANINEHNKEKPIFLAGDFNLPHINWENNALKSGGQSAHSQSNRKSNEQELEQSKVKSRS